MAGITLRNVSKQFGTTQVLNSIDLDIADGEFLTLVGPSGCGKSTTLRIIAGLETQTTGDVEIDGRNVNETRPSRRDLAMVFQSYALYPHLTVRQNLVTPLMLRDLSVCERLPLIGRFLPGRGAKKRAIDAMVEETAKTLQIEHLLGRKPGQLSGGQRQRVALGRAMVRKPEAFLMDEPLSNLDAGLRVHMRTELAELHRSLRTTFVYVTHDQAEALTMSDRMAVMMDGDVLQLGAPGDVYLDPHDLRVAKFIGSPQINVLPAEIDSSGRLTSSGVALETFFEGATNASASLGIRPEHLEVHRTEVAHGFAGRVSHKENLGSDIFLHISLGDSAHRIIARAEPSQAHEIAIGEGIWVRPEDGKLMVFASDDRRLPLSSNEPREEVA